jgi:hypothetical protein
MPLHLRSILVIHPALKSTSLVGIETNLVPDVELRFAG